MGQFIAVIVVGLLLTFQNCSQPLDQNANQTLQAFKNGLPFAYSAKIDTIAYMSCSRVPSGYDPLAYFTFKVGAYTAGSSGLGLNDTFLSATKYYSTDYRATAFAESEANQGAMLQLSIRKSNDYQTPVSGNQQALHVGQDLGPFLSELDTNPIASQLAVLGSNQFKNYFSGNTADFANGTGLMQSSLGFLQSETTITSVRSLLQTNQALLALTYTATADPASKDARGPNGTTKSGIYGTGYKIGFRTPSGWSGDNRVLSSVTEMDLGAGTTPAIRQWTCPPSMQFMIVRREDVAPIGNILCNQAPDPAPGTLSASDQKILTALRNVLPSGDWYIDMQYHCVVPTSVINATPCYGDRTNMVPIDYTSTSCTAFDGTNVGNCPHWVSVCLAQ